MAEKRGGPRENAGGKREGAGRPSKDITKLRQEFQQKCLTEWTTADDLKYIWQMTLGLAKRGDAGARADVFKYLLGNPVQPVEHSGSIDVTDVDARERLRSRIVSLSAGLRTGPATGAAETG